MNTPEHPHNQPEQEKSVETSHSTIKHIPTYLLEQFKHLVSSVHTEIRDLFTHELTEEEIKWLQEAPLHPQDPSIRPLGPKRLESLPLEPNYTSNSLFQLLIDETATAIPQQDLLNKEPQQVLHILEDLYKNSTNTCYQLLANIQKQPESATEETFKALDQSFRQVIASGFELIQEVNYPDLKDIVSLMKQIENIAPQAPLQRIYGLSYLMVGQEEGGHDWEAKGIQYLETCVHAPALEQLASISQSFKDREILPIMARTYTLYGQEEKAINTWEQALLLDQQNIDIQIELMKLYLSRPATDHRGRYEQHISTHLEQLVRQLEDGTCPPEYRQQEMHIRLALAQLYYKHSLHQKAIELLEPVTQKHTDITFVSTYEHTQMLVLSAYAKKHLHRFNEAQEELREAQVRMETATRLEALTGTHPGSLPKIDFSQEIQRCNSEKQQYVVTEITELRRDYMLTRERLDSEVQYFAELFKQHKASQETAPSQKSTASTPVSLPFDAYPHKPQTLTITDTPLQGKDALKHYILFLASSTDFDTSGLDEHTLQRFKKIQDLYNGQQKQLSYLHGFVEYHYPLTEDAAHSTGPLPSAVLAAYGSLVDFYEIFDKRELATTLGQQLSFYESYAATLNNAARSNKVEINN